jgi:hypothetical protein
MTAFCPVDQGKNMIFQLYSIWPLAYKIVWALAYEKTIYPIS